MGAESVLSSLSPSGAHVAVFLLVTISVGALLATYWLQRSETKRIEKRMQLAAAGVGPHRSAADPREQDSRRRKVVEDTLREIEAKDKSKARGKRRATLVGRMRQAGISWTRYNYFIYSVAVGLAAYAVALSGFRVGSGPAIGFGFAAGLALPHFYVSFRRSRRLRAFGAEFPNALDIVVRGIKAGLPLAECLSIIAAEAREPVRSEFAAILSDQTVGLPIDEAVARLGERIPLSEANFFAVVIAIHARTGGNLSEALGNLSTVLRERKNLRAKIKAMAAEGKASATIIGAMPVFVAVLLYLISPDYIMLLVSTTTGQVTLIASGLWMLVGSFLMRKMINFDF